MTRRPGDTRAAGWRQCATRRSCGEFWDTCSMKTSSSVLTVFGRCRSITVTIPLCFTWRDASTGLIIRGLLQMYPFYGPDFKVECPTGSGKYMTLFEVAKEIARRLSTIFLREI